MTPKQEKFCQLIADGLTQSDAYRASYDASNMGDASVHVQASKMMSSPKIALRVQELREALADRLMWAREDSVNALANIVRDDPSAPHAAKVAAVKELNAMHGYHEAKKVDNTSSDGSMSPAAPPDAALVEALVNKLTG